jgi:hypothetical protein
VRKVSPAAAATDWNSEASGQAVHIDIRLDRGLVQLRNIQQVGEQIFGAFQRLMGALHQ